MSVYRNEYGIGAVCHRAGCPFKVFRRELVTEPQAPPPFQPRPYPSPLAVPGPQCPIWALVRVPEPERTVDTAARLGLLTMEGNEGEVVWEIRDYQWSPRGHVSRTYPGKFVRTWKAVPGPFYGYFGFKRTRTIWLVEDCVSAAQIARAGGNSLALLGTHFSRDGIAELGAYLARIKAVYGPPVVKVALDPDAAGKGAALTRELTSRLGYGTVFVPLQYDPKDLPEGELEGMVREGPL